MNYRKMSLHSKSAARHSASISANIMLMVGSIILSSISVDADGTEDAEEMEEVDEMSTTDEEDSKLSGVVIGIAVGLGVLFIVGALNTLLSPDENQSNATESHGSNDGDAGAAKSDVESQMEAKQKDDRRDESSDTKDTPMMDK